MKALLACRSAIEAAASLAVQIRVTTRIYPPASKYESRLIFDPHAVLRC